ncbi:MAG TPA: hypothetical protein PK467_11165, partial [Candidatus Wallbacteria bacterium]|nr:hypothetical protein [Candidatus Wallbacteria bacterium]
SVMGMALAAAFAGLITAYKFYISRNDYLSKINKVFAAFIKIQEDKFYIDELYSIVIIAPLKSLSLFLHKFIDVRLIDDYIVGGTVRGFKYINSALSDAQSGRVQGYLSAMAAGLAVMTVYVLYNSIR